MARTTYVKRAQQRYETVPVIDPETGEPKQTPVMRPDGTQKITKSGRPVFRTVTVEDKSKPLPNLTCERDGTEIKPGDPYKWIAPKSGPYGGIKRVRCGKCPDWKVWEYSYSLSAQIARIEHEAIEALADVTDPSEVQEAASNAATEIRELAEEKRASAANIVDGFGHETAQSTELEEQADALEAWADDGENLDVPDLPEPEEDQCDECDGTGEQEPDNLLDEPDDCEVCGGTGTYTPEEPTDEQMDEWRSEAESVLTEWLGSAPV